MIVLARCKRCKSRIRVLPYDILPRKLYGLSVIEIVGAEYAEGPKSLREVAWGLMGERTPAFSTVHALSEGFGAYGLGRIQGEVGGGWPFSVLEAGTQARLPETRNVQAPEVDERRYRSEARRERLASGARILLVAGQATGEASPLALVTWCALALSWGRSPRILSYTPPLLFRTGLEEVKAERRPRLPETRDVQARGVDERGDRSKAHLEGWAAWVLLRLMAVWATEVSSPFALMTWCALVLSWARSPRRFSLKRRIFKTGGSSTALEQVEAQPRARSPPK